MKRILFSILTFLTLSCHAINSERIFDGTNDIFDGYLSGCFDGGTGALNPADPDSIIQWLYDTTGTNYLDKIDPVQVSSPINVGVPVLAFDGTTQWGNCGPAIDDIDVGFELGATVETSSTDGIINSYGASFAGGKRAQLSVASGKFVLQYDDDVAVKFYNSDILINDGLPHVCSAIINALTVDLTVDGTVVPLAHTMGLPLTPTGNMVIGASANIALDTITAPLQGKISNAYYGTADGIKRYYPLEENSIAVGYDIAGFGDVRLNKKPEQFIVDSPYSGISDEVVHPDIHIFDTPWNGYTHWMAYTPYPNADSEYENPSIAVSNDGINWTTPSGLTNPIVESPAGIAFNYDPDIHYDDTSGVLRVVYGTINESPDNAQHFYVESSDGVTWSSRVSILSVTRSVEGILSPSVLWDGSQWVMWTVDTDTAHTYANLHKRTKATWGDSWSAFTTCTLTGMTGTPPDSIWHMKVRLVDGGYKMLMSSNTSGGGELWWIESSDGDTWDFTKKIVLSKVNVYTRNWYRSTFWPYTEDGKRKYETYLGAIDWTFYKAVIEPSSVNCDLVNFDISQRSTMDSVLSRSLRYGYTNKQNLIQNGDLVSDYYWILGDGWSITDSKFVVTDTATSDQTKQFIPDLVVSRTYRLEFTAESNGGGSMFVAGASCFPSTDLGDVDGDVSFDLVVDDVSVPFIFSTVGWEGSIYNIKLYDVTLDEVYIPSSYYDSSFDARDGLPIGVRGSIDGALVHNGNPAGLRQIDGRIVDMITVSGTGTGVDRTLALQGLEEGKPNYYNLTEPYRVLADNKGNWDVLDSTTSQTWTIASDTQLPPKTGWSVGSLGSPAPTIEYGPEGSFWANDDGTLKDIYYTNFVAHANGYQALYLKSATDTIGSAGMCIVEETGQYPLDWEPTPTWYNQNAAYWTVCESFTNSLVPFMVLDGLGGETPWIDVNGNVLLLNPE